MAKGGITGDFAKLGDWSTRLSGAPTVLQQISRNMAQEGLALIAHGFRSETDPYGKPWKQLKSREGKILADTGRLRASWHIKRIDHAGFLIAAGVTYAKFHQEGTRNMVARRQVPANGKLPVTWRDAFVEVAEEVIRKRLVP
jgi:phage gpG-like protein